MFLPVCLYLSARKTFPEALQQISLFFSGQVWVPCPFPNESDKDSEFAVIDFDESTYLCTMWKRGGYLRRWLTASVPKMTLQKVAFVGSQSRNVAWMKRFRARRQGER